MGAIIFIFAAIAIYWFIVGLITFVSITFIPALIVFILMGVLSVAFNSKNNSD